MAHHKSAIKRIRTAEMARLRNRRYTREMRKSVKTLFAMESKEQAEPILNKTLSLLDRLAARNIIHKNKAAHQKSKLTRFVNSLG